jgi:hypothetical protein
MSNSDSGSTFDELIDKLVASTGASRSDAVDALVKVLVESASENLEANSTSLPDDIDVGSGVFTVSGDSGAPAVPPGSEEPPTANTEAGADLDDLDIDVGTGVLTR